MSRDRPATKTKKKTQKESGWNRGKGKIIAVFRATGKFVRVCANFVTKPQSSQLGEQNETYLRNPRVPHFPNKMSPSGVIKKQNGSLFWLRTRKQRKNGTKKGGCITFFSFFVCFRVRVPFFPFSRDHRDRVRTRLPISIRR